QQVGASGQDARRTACGRERANRFIKRLRRHISDIGHAGLASPLRVVAFPYAGWFLPCFGLAEPQTTQAGAIGTASGDWTIWPSPMQEGALRGAGGVPDSPPPSFPL